MQRDPHFRMLKIPLLIGGATTSRAHTAVKIAHNYEGPVVYVPDASRSVSVAQSLLTPETRDKYIDDISDDYARIREQHANKKALPMLSLARRARQQGQAAIRAGAPEVHRPPRVQERRPGARWRKLHRLGPVLPDLGPGRPLPGDPERPGGRRSGAQGVRGRPGAAEESHRRPLADRQRRDRAAAGELVNDDDIEIYTDDTRSEVAFT